MTSNRQGRVHKMLLDQLESLQGCGVMQVPKSRQSAPALRTSLSGSAPSRTAAGLAEAVAAENVRPTGEALVAPSQPAALAASEPARKSVPQSKPVLHSAPSLEPRTQNKPVLDSPSVATSPVPNMPVLTSAPVAGPSSCGHVASLDDLRQIVTVCTKCPALVQHRTQTVFGVGNPRSRVCFLGEAPGADEDRLGEPFVGRAGQLLTRMIEACTLRREDIYILNILKCRPPENRTPTPEEIENCRPFFERQLELLKPEFICCLGSVAARGLLQTNVPVGKLRGQVHNYKWAKVIVTYHPAYLLRSPDQKRAAWEDLQLLMREMGLPVPTKKFG